MSISEAYKWWLNEYARFLPETWGEVVETCIGLVIMGMYFLYEGGIIT